MRVALCLYGLVGGKVGKGGKGGDLNCDLSHNSYKKHILNKNNVDIFIHSWSTEHKDRLIKLYKPKKSQLETQKHFNNEISKTKTPNYEWFTLLKYKLLNLIRSKKINYYEYKERAFRSYSRWYSNKIVINLKKQYELENKFKYDFVMVSRLDLLFFTDIDFSILDNKYFYASHWNDAPSAVNGNKSNKLNHNKGKGFMDLWFFSNSNIMDEFSKLFDKQKDYDISPHFSSYQHISNVTHKIKYMLYRWDDYELIRRKLFKTKE